MTSNKEIDTEIDKLKMPYITADVGDNCRCMDARHGGPSFEWKSQVEDTTPARLENFERRLNVVEYILNSSNQFRICEFHTRKMTEYLSLKESTSVFDRMCKIFFVKHKRQRWLRSAIAISWFEPTSGLRSEIRTWNKILKELAQDGGDAMDDLYTNRQFHKFSADPLGSPIPFPELEYCDWVRKQRLEHADAGTESDHDDERHVKSRKLHELNDTAVADATREAMRRRSIENAERADVQWKSNKKLIESLVRTEPLLGWWFEDPELFANIVHEFGMYEHHTRILDNQRKDGYLYLMTFSICQQLARMDPALYKFVASNRKDHNKWLISFPVPAKSIKPGDTHYPPYILGPALSIIEDNATRATDLRSDLWNDCILVTNERPDNSTRYCREFVLGRSGSNLSPGEVKDEICGDPRSTDTFLRPAHAIRNRKTSCLQRWESFVDAELYPEGLGFAGTVRLSSPIVPLWDGTLAEQEEIKPGHHYTYPNVHRTLSVNYRGIDEDHCGVEGTKLSALEIAECHLYQATEFNEKQQLFYDGKPEPRFTSERFRIATQLMDLGPISKALVGRSRWDDDLVKEEMLLCWGVPWAFQKYYAQWKVRAKDAALVAYRHLKEREKEAYGDNSYFKIVEGSAWGIPHVPADPIDKVSTPIQKYATCDEKKDKSVPAASGRG